MGSHIFGFLKTHHFYLFYFFVTIAFCGKVYHLGSININGADLRLFDRTYLYVPFLPSLYAVGFAAKADSAICTMCHYDAREDACSADFGPSPPKGNT